VFAEEVRFSKHHFPLLTDMFRIVKVGEYFFGENRSEKIFLLPLTMLTVSLN
jgi:hypothetical protein